ncbi:MAG: rhodanese-like domain-containing protein [Chitinophagaceae bacterium]|nr:rhodanese-like domain-containing protein [Chitinophagaceae bacterium]
MTKQIVPLLSLLLICACGSTQDNYKEITLPDLMRKKQHGGKDMVIVDVRSNGEYYDSASRFRQSNIGRIKDAIHIELRELQQNPEALKKLEPYKDKEIYLICSHSYRSRAASNILLKNGFTNVSNVQGGMTEWYRRYDDLTPFREAYLESSVTYRNLSPNELFDQLSTNKNILLLGIRNTPRFFYDTATIRFYTYYPLPAKTVMFDYADSLLVLQEVQKVKDRPVVLFNLVNNGAAELAHWLANKGVKDVSYLVGGPNLFYETVANRVQPALTNKYFKKQTEVEFLTALNYCAKKDKKSVVLVDLRHDTLFNKVNDGVKHDFKHLKNAENFFVGKGEGMFEKQFTDKRKEYTLYSENGIEGLELADALSRKGYKISYLVGGTGRWEWYMNNVELFGCNDMLIK